MTGDPRGTRPAAGRRRRRRRRRPDRRLPAPAGLRRHPLRGRRPAGRARAHARRRRARRAAAGPGHRVHRAQRAHLPEPRPAVRRAGRRHQRHRDEHVGALRRAAAWSTRAPAGRAACSRPPAPWPGRPTWPCSPRPGLLPGGAAAARRARRRRPLTLGEFLRRGRYRRYFTGHFVVPLVAAVWSCSPADALDYPARYLFQFLDHHGMLSVAGSPGWRTVAGGSRSYVDRIAKQLTSVRAGIPGAGRQRGPRTASRSTTTPAAPGGSPRAVIATHPDQALRLLDRAHPRPSARCSARSATPPARSCCTPTPACCRRPRPARASWNYLLRDCAGAAEHVHVSYYLNRLQGLDEPAGLPGHAQRRRTRSRPASVIAEMSYAHPLYTPASVAAQRRLPGPEHAGARLRRAPTTAGDSTRTAAGPASGPPPPWGSTGDRRPVPVPDHPRPDPPGPPALPLPQLPVAGRPRRPAAGAPAAAAARPRSGPATTWATRRPRSGRTWTPTWPATASTWPAARCSCSASAGCSATSSTRSPCTGATAPTGAWRRCWPRCTTPTGERHVYLLRPDARGRAGAAKDFYVSPFLPLAGPVPDAAARARPALRLSITPRHRRPARPLTATVRGRAARTPALAAAPLRRCATRGSPRR